MRTIHLHLFLTAAFLATTAAHSFAQEAELLAVLRSDATLQEKSAACRQLARIATKESVPTLASMLGDEKLSHMARYALEPIRDPSVDDALRDALGKVQGRPRLGVIGSLAQDATPKPSARSPNCSRRPIQRRPPRVRWEISVHQLPRKPWMTRCPRHRMATNWPSAKAYSAAPKHWRQKAKGNPRNPSTIVCAVSQTRRNRSAQQLCEARFYRAVRTVFLFWSKRSRVPTMRWPPLPCAPPWNGLTQRLPMRS